MPTSQETNIRHVVELAGIENPTMTCGYDSRSQPGIDYRRSLDTNRSPLPIGLQAGRVKFVATRMVFAPSRHYQCSDDRSNTDMNELWSTSRV